MDRFGEKLSAFRVDTRDTIEELKDRIRLNELYRKQEEREECKNCIKNVVIAISVIILVVAAAYAIYRIARHYFFDDEDYDLDDEYLFDGEEEAEPLEGVEVAQIAEDEE
ncbi:MAG: hypothetical protein Q4B86_02525 [Eubacteriales bacterium]|nr:hypothetical protein [Eubacteriales bacterium]